MVEGDSPGRAELALARRPVKMMHRCPRPPSPYPHFDISTIRTYSHNPPQRRRPFILLAALPCKYVTAVIPV